MRYNNLHVTYQWDDVGTMPGSHRSHSCII